MDVVILVYLWISVLSQIGNDNRTQLYLDIHFLGHSMESIGGVDPVDDNYNMAYGEEENAEDYSEGYYQVKKKLCLTFE